MKILIDIGHPAHVHFFKNAIDLLKAKGHTVIITSRDKEFAIKLLDDLGLEHFVLSKMSKGGLLGLGMELIKRNIALYKIVRKTKPDIMMAIGGVNIAQIGKLTRTPSLVFYDTENAKLQNAITYPFASCVIAPRCYESWLPKRRHVRYAGYHELAYLRKNVFSPDQSIAIKSGIKADKDNFLIRLVSWQANHDVGENGFSTELTQQLVTKLASLGNVMITSESGLPNSLRAYEYTGDISNMHHVLAHCRLYVGESATMASEAAVLGVPALYVANTGRGYTNEQESRYALVKNVVELKWDKINAAIEQMLLLSKEQIAKKRATLLKDTVDVSDFTVECVESYPQFLNVYQQSQGV